jgi:hypothetical protein
MMIAPWSPLFAAMEPAILRKLIERISAMSEF